MERQAVEEQAGLNRPWLAAKKEEEKKKKKLLGFTYYTSYPIHIFFLGMILTLYLYCCIIQLEDHAEHFIYYECMILLLLLYCCYYCMYVYTCTYGCTTTAAEW